MPRGASGSARYREEQSPSSDQSRRGEQSLSVESAERPIVEDGIEVSTSEWWKIAFREIIRSSVNLEGDTQAKTQIHEFLDSWRW